MSTLGAIQFAVDPSASVDENCTRALETIRSLPDSVDIACLPEYFSTSYFPATVDESAFELAVSADGAVVDSFASVARETATALVVPIFERGESGGRYYSSAVVIDAEGERAGVYRKLHVLQRPEYEEAYYFAPGDRGAPVFEVGGLTVGVMLCYDRHFPEIARVQALRGADLVVIPTCSFGEENRDAVWEAELTALAVSNSVYVAGVNRAGTDAGKRHFGATTVVDPTGETVGSLGTEPDVLLASIAPERVVETRRRTHHLTDVRPELLGDRERL